MDIEPTQADPVVETPIVETPAPVVKQETIGEALAPEPKEAKVVPEAAFLQEKKERKALEKRVKELEASAKSGASEDEISSDIQAIGKEFGVDEKFLSKLSSAIERNAEELFSSKLKPLEAKDKAEKIEKVFSTHYDKAMAEMPEFKGVVNRDVIKSLSLDPANQTKTFQQLIEDTYGNALGGKRTLETTTPRGGKSPDGIDFARASKDQTYYNEIMSNPDLKKEYNANLTDRLSANL